MTNNLPWRYHCFKNININKIFILLEINIFWIPDWNFFIVIREIGLNAQFNKYSPGTFIEGFRKINTVEKRGI